ncbi:MAG: hypothetical protein MUE44_24050 [Oscillatoriaceae cyanobacterium Prado104]|nr:hypothetical protein [Oscillatoriaceae cyanobacterium Prado104]
MKEEGRRKKEEGRGKNRSNCRFQQLRIMNYGLIRRIRENNENWMTIVGRLSIARADLLLDRYQLTDN